MNLKKIGKVFTSKSVGTGPSSYEKRIYRVAISQRLRNPDIGYVQGLVLKQVQKAYVWGSLFSALTSTV